jgi:hypothetical protein
MQGRYNYIPQTNRDSRVYSFAAILYLQFMATVMLFPMLNVCTFILILYEVSVHCPIRLLSVVP